jgi:23S rRNA pseudouridine2605 synthase
MSERIQKVLARSGVASRRKIEALILQGVVLVNDRQAVLGQAITPQDVVKVCGQHVRCLWDVKPQVLLYYKPIGEICTHSDPEGRPTVFQKLPAVEHGKWISVGRLDINSEGLLLVTNHGVWAHRLMHPSFAVRRVYLVRLAVPPTDQMVARLLAGVVLEDGPARFDRAELHRSGKHPWYRVQVSEGRHRLVRRLWQSQNCLVSRLMRVQYGPVCMPKSMRPGQLHEVTKPLDAYLS